MSKSYLALKSDVDTISTRVTTAQSTADTAKTNAATAQNTANTAKTNAATAQTTANNAKTAADNAASAASTAQSTANSAETNSQWRYNDAVAKINNKMNSDNPTGSLNGGNFELITLSGYTNDVGSSNKNVIIGYKNNLHPTLSFGSSWSASGIANKLIIIGDYNECADGSGNGGCVIGYSNKVVGAQALLSTPPVVIGCDNLCGSIYSSGNVKYLDSMEGFIYGNDNTLSDTNGPTALIGDSLTLSAGDCPCVVIGKYNNSSNSRYSLFVVGYGKSGATANVFRITSAGTVYGGTYNSSGADYAEYFEWTDGNPNNEDRIGRFVTLDNENIRIANSNDEFILGVISGSPSVVGDSYDDQWNQMYLTDIYGRPIMEEVTIAAEYDDEGNLITKEYTEIHPKLNPNYNNTQTYIGRSKRPEWDCVGMLGKLVMRDDGTSKVNEYVKSNDYGEATYSEEVTKFRVLSRLDENHIKVLII